MIHDAVTWFSLPRASVKSRIGPSTFFIVSNTVMSASVGIICQLFSFQQEQHTSQTAAGGNDLSCHKLTPNWLSRRELGYAMASLILSAWPITFVCVSLNS